MNNATVVRFLTQAAIWGGSFTFIKMALVGLTPGQLVFARVLLAAVVLTLIARARRVPMPRSVSAWFHIAVATVFGTVVPYLLLSYGELNTGAGVAGVLVGGTPLLTLLIATMVLPSERANRRTLIGFALGFVGVALVVAPWAGPLGSTAARLACFGAALSYAVGYVYVRKFVSHLNLPALGLAAAQLIAATGLQGLALPFMQWHTPTVDLPILLAVAVLGVLGTGFAQVLYFRLIADVGATNAAAVDYLVPVFAVIVAVLALGEPIGWNLVVGGLIVLVGMAIAEGRLGELLRARRSPRTIAVPATPDVPAAAVTAPAAENETAVREAA